MRSGRLRTLCLAAVLALTAPALLAGPHGGGRRGGDEDRHWRDDRDGGRDGGREYRGRGPREQAAERARRSSRGGRVLSAEPQGSDGYRVRVLTPDGYIRNLTVDPHRHED